MLTNAASPWPAAMFMPGQWPAATGLRRSSLEPSMTASGHTTEFYSAETGRPRGSGGRSGFARMPRHRQIDFYDF
jgi:hypothetical protein